MKIKKIILLLLISIMFISCDLFLPKADNSIEIFVGNSISRDGGSSTILNDPNVKSVKVRIFYNSTGQLVENSDLTLTKESNGWKVDFDYSNVEQTENVIFHAMAFNGENGTGEIIYQGTTTNPQPISNFGSTITIPTGLEYEVGDRGPGGGWIIYDKGTYDNDTSNEMGKSWRYLEISPSDLEEDWSDNEQIDTENYFISVTKKNGKVYSKKINTNEDDIDIILDTNDFYWGYTGDLSTEQPLKEGYENTYTHLDGVSTATPKTFKGKGRKSNKATNNETNLRRDTVTILKTKNINNFTDWFIPSKDELELIYDNAENIPTNNYGLSGKYWTSSEDKDGQNKTTTDTTITSQLNASEITAFGVDDNWAWSVDFDNSTKESAITVSERYQTYKVRPARAF